MAANYYPEEGNTYEFVDHFTSQVTAVNTNTTISVSIDGGSIISMNDYGIRHEMAPGDITTRDWFTWEITVPAITAPGNHTFQFFSHYYVWQQADQNWAEYNSYSNIKSFTISDSNPTLSTRPTETAPSTDYQTIMIIALIIGVIASIALIVWQFKPSSVKKND